MSEFHLGIGIGQIVSISMVTTYYVAIMGMTVRYLFDSFKSPLPWSQCSDSWNAVCVPSMEVNTAEFLYNTNSNNSTLSSTPSSIVLSNVSSVIMNNVTNVSLKPKASAELYFL